MALTAEEAGLLQSLAQIAVAFAGFAGVIGAFNRFSTHVRVTAFRVRGMVALALFALLVTLAPLAVAALGAGVDSVWRITTGFSAALGVLLYAFLLREVLPLFRQRLLRTQALNMLWYGLSATIILSLGAVAAGLIPAKDGAGVYVASTVFLLVLCAYNFLMLVLSISFDADHDRS